MISESAYLYCKDDVSLIENYKLAANDKEQTWDVHHRLETDLGLSKTELIKQDKYLNVPANELIFLRHDEHARLHMSTNNSRAGKDPWNKDKKMSKEFCINCSEGHKGKTAWNKDKKMSKEFCINCSEGHKGKTAWNKCMTKEEMKNYKKQ